MVSIRDKFVKRFGEEQAKALEDAAEHHKNGVHDRKGSDPFKWVILICIGYQCFESESYREYHGINIPFLTLKRWIKRNADLASHDGDCDYLALISGAYQSYMPTPKKV